MIHAIPAGDAELARPLMRHAWGFDEGDWALVESAYTVDAIVEVVLDDGIPFMPVPVPRAVGRDAILDGYRRSYETFVERGERPWHVISNVLVDDRSEDRATVRSFNQFLKTTPRGVTYFGVSRYHDEVVKRDGEWRIASRINRISYALPPDDG
jgi:hypothetical protein